MIKLFFIAFNVLIYNSDHRVCSFFIFSVMIIRLLINSISYFVVNRCSCVLNFSKESSIIIYCYIHYPKYDIGFTNYDKYSHLISTFICKNKSYIINKRTSKRNIARNIRLMCDLKNKYSLIYPELIKGLDKFNKGKSFYFVSKEISEEILKTYDISYRQYLSIELYSNKFYYDWDSECLLEINKNQFPVIYLEC